MTDFTCTLASVHVYPIKSCGGLTLESSLLIETGLELDRAWMVADHHGDMLTQREWPQLALVGCQLKGNELVLRAPGMLALHLRVDAAEKPMRAQVWDDAVNAFDMGNLAAQWFSDYLFSDHLNSGGQNPRRLVRLLRFDPNFARHCDPKWTGPLAAQTAFADGYPLLVANAASLQDLNQRLAANTSTAAAAGRAVDMRRFRPNLVLDGLPAYEEDHVHTLTIDTAEGEVELRLVKPCLRCSMPNINPDTAVVSKAVGDTLATYRADPRVGGAMTFGMNAIVVRGVDHTLQAGQTVRGRLNFA